MSFHIIDDALREDGDPHLAHEPMPGGFARLGAEGIDPYLLPGPVRLTGARAVAPSGVPRPLGSLTDGVARVDEDASPVTFQKVPSHALSESEGASACTVAGLMAGSELMGVALMRPGSLGIDAQTMASLNTGSALRHLRMLATEREPNRIPNGNDPLSERGSRHDEMTGPLNRRGFFSHAGIAIPESTCKQAAVTCPGLDGLKAINDTHGHDAGDEAIRETGRLLRSCLGERGILCRMGGDEFCALVFGDDDAMADFVASVMQPMRASNDRGGAPHRLDISAGPAPFEVARGRTPGLAAPVVEADGKPHHMKRGKRGPP